MPNTPPTRGDLANVVIALDHLEGRIDEAKQQSKQTADRTRNLAAVAIAAACLGILVGVAGILAAQKAQDAVDEVNRQRAENIVTACNRFNEEVAVNHNGIVDELVEFVAFLGQDQTPEDPRTPDEQALIDRLVGQRQAEFASRMVRYRDCSDRGIAAYYDTGGAEGYLPEGEPP